MGEATGRPAGRPKGSKSVNTLKREGMLADAAKAVAKVIPGAFAGDAHTLLMAIYKDPSHEWSLRIDAAKAAIRYEKPALASVVHGGDKDNPIAVRRIETVVVDPKAKA